MKFYNLHHLLNPWVHNAPMRLISNITLESYLASHGFLFIAIPGHKTDGRNFIKQVINQGVTAIIAESESKIINGKIYYINGTPIIYIHQLYKKISHLAGLFFDNPSEKHKVIGVTGTNGKTTITHILAQWIQLLGETTAVMGTLGNGLINQLMPTKNTTSSAIDIQKILYELINKGTTLTAMEISSHGLMQYRVAALSFAAALFTNISHEHIDYHKNMHHYELAKWRLFSEHNIDNAIINIDDEVGMEWSKKIPKAIIVTTKHNINLKRFNRWLKIHAITIDNNGTNISFNSSWGSGKINSHFIGNFNISNLIMALTTLLSLNYKLNELLEVSSELKPIIGRMELFNMPNKPKIIIDYAHTPDALKKVLIAARPYCKNKIWCIFGCGGERDKSKRPIMGKIAESLSDIVIITTDNPRNENQNIIIQNIVSGFTHPYVVKIINERTAAIKYAMLKATPNDLILILGKGHENYQIVGNTYFSHSDKKVVISILKNII
ncbi:MAG: UDP-N-acetylmuramoyl-L-alanyl-D-glutamate--2,6-diaminopimelate ligase [Pantoea sp. Brub]|nr:UDP-N-acetylmuramoyl-L-alanyl-D-glutamate--2,6-diaminopimelate ligase [Pantoea sp. Brub]